MRGGLRAPGLDVGKHLKDPPRSQEPILPSYVEVVRLLEDFFGAGACWGNSASPHKRCSFSEFDWASDEVDCTSSEMERSRYATHPAIMGDRAPARGNSKSWMSSKKDMEVEGGVRGQAPAELEFFGGRCMHDSPGVVETFR